MPRKRTGGRGRPTRVSFLGAMLVAAGLLAAGCGGADDDPLTVSAASSLTEAFAAYGAQLPGDERFSFGGSDTLAAQIRRGARPDVFASANTSYPEELAAEGLVGEPVVFARNELVIAAAPGSGVESIGDLAEPGLDLVIGAEGVPVGDYTREVLAKLPANEREAILANVRSAESDVKGVIGKVAQGAADAGFVYSSDVAAAGGELTKVGIPARLEPEASYGIAIVSDAPKPEQAQAFIDGLLRGEGAKALAQAGLLPPPITAGSAAPGGEAE